MSDGGISLADAWGFETNELARVILVKPDWLAYVRSCREQLLSEVRTAVARSFPPYSEKKTSEPKPAMPDDIEAFLKKIADGEKVFGKWTWGNDRAVNAIHTWNGYVECAWYHKMGF